MSDQQPQPPTAQLEDIAMAIAERPRNPSRATVRAQMTSFERELAQWGREDEQERREVEQRRREEEQSQREYEQRQRGQLEHLQVEMERREARLRDVESGLAQLRWWKSRGDMGRQVELLEDEEAQELREFQAREYGRFGIEAEKESTATVAEEKAIDAGKQNNQESSGTEGNAEQGSA